MLTSNLNEDHASERTVARQKCGEMHVTTLGFGGDSMSPRASPKMYMCDEIRI
jgi:hypothetical protein